MANKSAVLCSNAPAPIGPYSQAIKANGMLFVSGQLGIDMTTGELAPLVEEQTEFAIKNLTAVLESEGLTLSNVVKVTLFLDRMDDFSAVNAVFGRFFSADTPPARSCVSVEQLPKNAQVEIEAIAVY